MPPANPEKKTTDDGRITVPVDMLTDWLAAAIQNGSTFFLVPLAWKWGVFLPAGHELEAWYAWQPGLKDGEWEKNPADIFGASENGQFFYLRRLIYSATLEQKKGSRRLSSSGLISSLQKNSGGCVWVAQEPHSVSIWTDFAYNYWYSRLGHSEP